MKQFTGAVILESLRDEKFILRSTLIYENSNIKITLKDGLITNGASIPRFLWSAFGSPLIGEYLKPAIVHDGLYASHALSKNESDDLFLEMLITENVNILKSYAFYYSVKIFGGCAWAKNPEYIDIMKNFVKIEFKR